MNQKWNLGVGKNDPNYQKLYWIARGKPLTDSILRKELRRRGFIDITPQMIEVERRRLLHWRANKGVKKVKQKYGRSLKLGKTKLLFAVIKLIPL